MEKYIIQKMDMKRGNWENDQQMGQRKEDQKDGSTYIDNYEYGKKEGLGKYIWEDGTFYYGEWKNNNIHGLGVYKWSDGRQYTGEWKNAKMYGFGISTWNHGEYIGSYKKDKKQELEFIQIIIKINMKDFGKMDSIHLMGDTQKMMVELKLNFLKEIK